MLVPILVVAGLTVLLFSWRVVKLVRIYRRPSGSGIERSLAIKAPADKIFPFINDFHNWASWSPFEQGHPEITRTFSGEEQGIGAVYEWQGKWKTGRGRLEIVASVEPRTITIRTVFFKPNPSQCTMEFALVASPTSTEITWSMQSPPTLLGGLMRGALEEIVGKEIARGLANLKTLVEH